ncbi:Phosphorylase superfamily protein [Maridesulfovibrio ferrireducens]|uniref:Phosphorylase superfamily protein n=1 Tax=Maridesulfovibrio ferrireducens TaxID=246191 RepID=A0A1G9JRT1_9BACT|nr:phosphorylase [Maridesulfovibrio ferrireducens]SDL40300.1 Phosphorylase superfamily protein [Maridesulfovibrio ferrireducens]
MPDKTVGIVAAMEQEAKAICPVSEKSMLGRFELLSGILPGGNHFMCIVSGIGTERAAEAATLLAQKKPSLILSAGVSGGLARGTSAGDLLAASTIHSEIPDFAPWHEPEQDADIRKELLPAYRRIPSGPMVTAAAPVMTQQEKTSLHDKTGALAADMESIAVAQVAAKEGIPFACIRAVSDASTRAIPAESLNGVTASGKTQLTPILKAIANRPSLILELIPMGMDYSKALKSLGKIFI